MRRPLNEYSTLRRGYERQRQQENEEWMLQVATFGKSFRWLIHSLGSHLMMWRRELGQMRHMAVSQGDGFDDVRDSIHLFPELTTLPSLEPEEEKG